MQVAASGLSSNPQPSEVPLGGRNIRRALSYSRHPLGLGQGVSWYDIRVVQSPSDCILRSVSPLCPLPSDVSGPPPLTPWASKWDFFKTELDSVYNLNDDSEDGDAGTKTIAGSKQDSRMRSLAPKFRARLVAPVV